MVVCCPRLDYRARLLASFVRVGAANRYDLIIAVATMSLNQVPMLDSLRFNYFLTISLMLLHAEIAFINGLTSLDPLFSYYKLCHGLHRS